MENILEFEENSKRSQKMTTQKIRYKKAHIDSKKMTEDQSNF